MALVLSHKDLAQALPMDECIEAMAAVLTAHARGGVGRRRCEPHDLRTRAHSRAHARRGRKRATYSTVTVFARLRG